MEWQILHTVDRTVTLRRWPSGAGFTNSAQDQQYNKPAPAWAVKNHHPNSPNYCRGGFHQR
jgi:hypothetical protein